MGKIGAIFLGIIALFLLIGPFRDPLITGIHGWRTIDTTEPGYSVTVPVDNTTVHLNHDIYQAATSEINSITTNITGSPGVYAYVETTRMLTINGLNPGLQTIVVRYYAETDDQVMRLLGPFLAFFVFFGVAGLIVWAMVGNKGRRR